MCLDCPGLSKRDRSLAWLWINPSRRETRIISYGRSCSLNLLNKLPSSRWTGGSKSLLWIWSIPSGLKVKRRSTRASQKQIWRYEQVTLLACARCGSSDTAEVSRGIVSRSIHLASATTKFKLHINPPGRYFCNVCEEYFSPADGASPKWWEEIISDDEIWGFPGNLYSLYF